jgi:4-hydroxybenzoate polyprenyltransferase
MEKLRKQILNLRPYSWVDLILLAYLAKFSVTGILSFSVNDIILIVEVLLWWFYFNSVLEMKKNHSYRARVPKILPILFLASMTVLALFVRTTSLIPLVVSTIGILLYLKKEEQKFWGITSCVIRGLIQVSFFIFILFFLKEEISVDQIILSVVIFLLFVERAILGDLRDEKSDRERRKMTIVVVLGTKVTKWISILILLTSVLVLLHFGSVLATLPILFLTLLLFFYSNGYILHQLMIFTTSAVWVNCIAIFTGQNLVLLNLIYLGILLNLVFYPLLERKSNPIFK